MQVRNVHDAKDWFEVMQTGQRVQTAVMFLEPGQSSGSEAEAHESSDQVLLVLEGEVHAEVEKESRTLSKGDLILIPAGHNHKFTNKSSKRVLTFNTYSPPEY